MSQALLSDDLLPVLSRRGPEATGPQGLQHPSPQGLQHQSPHQPTGQPCRTGTPAVAALQKALDENEKLHEKLRSESRKQHDLQEEVTKLKRVILRVRTRVARNVHGKAGEELLAILDESVKR